VAQASTQKHRRDWREDTRNVSDLQMEKINHGKFHTVNTGQ
jgi:hypothetical protein